MKTNFCWDWDNGSRFDALKKHFTWAHSYYKCALTLWTDLWVLPCNLKKWLLCIVRMYKTRTFFQLFNTQHCQKYFYIKEMSTTCQALIVSFFWTFQAFYFSFLPFMSIFYFKIFVYWSLLKKENLFAWSSSTHLWKCVKVGGGE